jgi:hypothetical protein
MAIAPDDVLLVRAVSKKLFRRTATVTVQRDGRGDHGVPAGRPDLVDVDARLRQPLDFDYQPYRCWTSEAR